MIRIQITDGAAIGNEARWLASLRSDVDFIQVRERGVSASHLVRLVKMAMRVAPVLVNDRADVALACGAAGVHLRSGSIAPTSIRRLGRFTISVACHNEEEVAAAQDADYALLAPVFAPLSKQDSRKPLGLGELRRIAQSYSTPVIALGGVTPENSSRCVEAGAAGVAGISLFRQ